jgi:DNA-binding transcriptional regulator YiaG
MAKFDESIDELDALIDKAVDTVFVEEPGEAAEELEDSPLDEASSSSHDEETPEVEIVEEGPSLDDAMDSLFTSSFEESAPEEAPPPEPDGAVASYESPKSDVSSGDPEMDLAIDAAVDTLFVEDFDVEQAPETAQVDVDEVISEPQSPPPPPAQKSAQPEPVEKPAAEQAPQPAANKLDTIDFSDVFTEEVGAPESEAEAEESSAAYDDALAFEIEKHMHSLFTEQASQPEPQKPQPQAKPAAKGQTPKQKLAAKDLDTGSLRTLQEAILTLEWEISERSIEALRKELKKLRSEFSNDVTVDFAALSMRVVLDYIVKRMSKAHPESVRFLLEVTQYIDQALSSAGKDPLLAFHKILTRYENYKSIVRKAEGLPDNDPKILGSLEIQDLKKFSELVEAQSMAIIKASYSLVKRIDAGGDTKNLIRSFRFLINRSVSQILDRTQAKKVVKPKSKKVKKKVKPVKKA